MNNALAINCEKHPIYCQIIKNKPTINKMYALELSNIIYKYTKAYKISSSLYTAILMQESSYKLDSKNCNKGLREPSEIEKAQGITEMVEDEVCLDLGISQINIKTIRNFDLDPELLITDLEYSIESGLKVLKDFKKRYKHKEPDWWTRYNASNEERRNMYKESVSKYL